MILNDLWMGGMSIRRYLNWKVIASILFFPLVLRIEFKSVEELKLQPKTHEEHLANQEDSDFSDDDDDDDSEEYNSGTPSNDLTQSRSKEDFPPLPTSSSHRKNETLVEFILENQHLENESIEMMSMNKSINDRPPSPSRRTLSVSIPTTEDINDISIEANKKIEGNLPKETSSIPLTQRFYEFYNAPITKFWYNAIFYLLFLFLFTYMVLVRTPPTPSIAGRRSVIFFIEEIDDHLEYLVTIYLASSALDAAREVCLEEGLSCEGLKDILDLYNFISTFSTSINGRISFSFKSIHCFVFSYSFRILFIFAIHWLY